MTKIAVSTYLGADTGAIMTSTLWSVSQPSKQTSPTYSMPKVGARYGVTGPGRRLPQLSLATVIPLQFLQPHSPNMSSSLVSAPA